MGSDHDVSRLEVPVEDPMAVGIPNRVANLFEYGDEPRAVFGRAAASLE